MNIQYGPIVRWPGKLRSPGERIRAPFKSGHTDTLRLLERELRSVSAETPVVQLAVPEGQWTRDGRPYANARGDHPGVIVSFSKPHRAEGKWVKVPLSFPCDRFTTWETNLRAVAIALEDLRRIDRYGVTQNAEQYHGFKSLPGPVSSMPTMNAEQAARFVADVANKGGGCTVDAGQILSDPLAWAQAYRQAAGVLRPDRAGEGGEAGTCAWHQLQTAKSLLDALYARH
jgi:hypothetical protein